MTNWNQFNPLPRGSYTCDMRSFRWRGVRFVPNGPVFAVGDVSRFRRNPKESIDLVPLTARLFVGLNVGQESTYDVDDVVRVTKRVRKSQGEQPDASFLLQRGLYTDQSGALVEEDSVQVVVFDFTGDEARFEDQMGELGEVYARELRQEVVYVELQRQGIPFRMLRVTP